MIQACYGAGTNSTALLIGLHKNGVRPDVITFSDTVGERPHTYQYRNLMNEWCKSVGFPEIVTVRVESTTLEEDCLRRKALPSVAYGGFKSCSQRFKQEPQEKYMNNHPDAKKVWEDGGRVIKFIGFDADEPGRGQPFSDKKFINQYPLIEWNWGRDECIEAIRNEGLPLPGKSSCFFCPNMKQSEISEVKQHYPELAERAIAMERNANLDSVKGLGRDWSWEALLQTDEMFTFPERFQRVQCGSCYDEAAA